MVSGKFIPSSFNSATVQAGLRKAMQFGAPVELANRATFFLPPVQPTAGSRDLSGVPFDPDIHDDAAEKSIQVDCAIEDQHAADVVERFGDMAASRLKIILLDVDYQQVKGFDRVTVGGVPYIPDDIEAPVALGAFNVWTVWVTRATGP